MRGIPFEACEASEAFEATKFEAKKAERFHQKKHAHAGDLC